MTNVAVSRRIVARPAPDAEPADTGTIAVWFWCPGCDAAHCVNVGGSYPGPKWAWNGSLDKPTFGPSILVHPTPPVPETGYPGTPLCHSFVNDGSIQFLADSTHKLAGQTVDIPQPPEWLR